MHSKLVTGTTGLDHGTQVSAYQIQIYFGNNHTLNNTPHPA